MSCRVFLNGTNDFARVASKWDDSRYQYKGVTTTERTAPSIGIIVDESSARGVCGRRKVVNKICSERNSPYGSPEDGDLRNTIAGCPVIFVSVHTCRAPRLDRKWHGSKIRLFQTRAVFDRFHQVSRYGFSCYGCRSIIYCLTLSACLIWSWRFRVRLKLQQKPITDETGARLESVMRRPYSIKNPSKSLRRERNGHLANADDSSFTHGHKR